MEVEMKKTLKRSILMTLACAMFALSGTAQAASPCPNPGDYYVGAACVPLTADQAWTKMLDGNALRFKFDTPTNLVALSAPTNRQALATNGQKPYAIVLTCSDSRVAPEILFDTGLGEIFVVRVAGNIVAPHELGSIEYAIEHLGTRLIVVLGHEKCGAVSAAYDVHGDAATYSTLSTGIKSLVDSIDPAITDVLALNAPPGSKPTGADAAATKLLQDPQKEECAIVNTLKVVESMKAGSTIIEEYDLGIGPVAPNTVKIVRAKYNLNGLVTELP
jgi:carbonic anhydrase